MKEVPRYDGVIFDMDGTLVDSPLDFAAIRAALDIPADSGILEAINAMAPPQQLDASSRLLEFEMEAARTAELVPGTLATLEAIRVAGLPTALLTRNAEPVMRTILERFGMRFDLAWSRENGPIKPEPDGILRACERLGVSPARTLCVGDFRYDMEAARAAGACGVLLARLGPPDWAHLADHVIDHLADLLDLLGLNRAG